MTNSSGAMFSGARLREAREARGFTAVQLAECVGVRPQAISQYESSRIKPRPDVLEALARVLNMPMAFFTMPPRDNPSGGLVFYRSMSAATKRARTSACWKLQWLEDLAGYLSCYVEFPDPNMPPLTLSTDPLQISDDEIEQAAIDAREYWRMGSLPVGNMISLLENQGVIVARHPLGADTLDGLSFFDESGRPYVVVGTDKGSAARWRFDAAHELGHLILHRGVDPKTFGRPELFKMIEAQAHRFARAFLLPLDAFGDDLFATSLDVLRGMKPRWGVSIAAMLMRARDGHLMSEETEKRLWINLSRRGWRKEEPYDRETLPEEPRMLRRAVELVLSERAQTIDDMLFAIGLSASDFEALVGLPSGFVQSNGFAPVQLRPSPISDAPVRDRAPGTVVDFRRRMN